MEALTRLITDVPDFPKKGVMFKDITPLLADPAGLALAVEMMANPFRGKRVDTVIGIESRGFIFGTAVAQSLSAGFIPVRKPGKLPRKTIGVEYELEYGVDRVEMHEDAVERGQRVLIVDDVIATGGTLKACRDLVLARGGDLVGASILIELETLKGRLKVDIPNLHAVLRF
ncbi:MAG: adenine phosphoribosyltransferase [Phycisphaerales bacterium]